MDQGVASMSRSGRKAPPYVSYRTFRGLLDELHGAGVPHRIEATAMASVPHTVRNQMLTGLRFLYLVDGDGLPTDSLRDLVTNWGTDQRAQHLRLVLEAAYPEILGPDVGVNSNELPADQLADMFNIYGLSDDVRRKCYIFFAAAAHEAGISLNSQTAGIIGSITDRRPSLRRRPSGHSIVEVVPGGGLMMRHQQQMPTLAAPPSPPPNLYRAAFEAVSAIWTPGQMSDDVDAAVVTLLRYLRTKETEPKA